MQQHRLAQIHFIEPLGAIGEQHNGEFQTLGFMNGHDAHHISRALRLRRGNFAARFPQLSDIAHKGKQAAAAAALKAARQFNERRNMILPRLAVRHRAEHAHRTGLIDNVPQQLMHRQIGRQHAQLRELVEKCLRFRHGLCGGRQRTIILAVHITQANFRQIFLCKSANRRIECRQQRNILPRIVYDFQP